MTVVALHQQRGVARRGKPLPPLSRRATRVLLLASSYPDACDASERDTVHRGKPGSRILVRFRLWQDGSYREMERLLDELRGHDRVLYGRFWRAYIGQRFPAGRPLDTPAQRRDAGYALVWLAKRMPASIYVPAEISEAAGYTPGDARAYARPRRGAA